MDETDPRTSGEHQRRPAGAEGPVLVGVVHDHPASQHRVGAVISDVEPDVLALELPPLSVPLFEAYADDGIPSAVGGEMSAAIRAASTDRVVGIDGPTPRFSLALARNLYRADADSRTVRRALSGLASATSRAVVCRLAAGVTAHTGLGVAVDRSVAHDCGPDDDPHEQAADERAQVRRARAAARVFEPARAARVRDATREEHMARRISALDGRAVAVVGIDHLDAVADRLG
jgi:pheromone shutdown protein TraB